MGVMKTFTREASVLWVGTRARGKGAINTPGMVLKMALYASDGVKRGGTNPSELIAAAQTAIDVLRRAAKDRAGIYEMLECADALAALLPEPDR